MKKNNSKVIVFLGPSAAGKSLIAFSLAKELAAEIVSADAFQIYRGMNIGTGKPSDAAKEEVAHYLIDIINPDENFDVARFKKLASTAIEKILKDKKVPFVVGGTGLYIRSLIEGICAAPPRNESIRKNLEKLGQSKGRAFLYSKLQKIDRDSARRIHPNDLRRIIRALEVYQQTGLPLSQLQAQIYDVKKNFEFIKIGLIRPRKELYNRSEERIEEMFKLGWVEEVKTLLDNGYGPELPSMHALGYREIARFILSRLTLAETKKLIKKNTRHFIKRQLTWFKKEKNVNWITISAHQSSKETLKKVKEILYNRNI